MESGPTHPLETLLPSRASRILAALCFAAATVWLGWIMQRLVRGITPSILAFEFAATPARAAQIIDQWGVSGEARMLAQIGLDNWWLALYSTTLASLCVMVAIRLRPHSLTWANYGVSLAWAAWLAALLDRMENFALVQVIEGSRSILFTMGAAIFAAIKFVIVIACLLYIIFSPILFSRSRQKLSPPNPSETR